MRRVGQAWRVFKSACHTHFMDGTIVSISVAGTFVRTRVGDVEVVDKGKRAERCWK